MTVGELIEVLQQFPKEMKIIKSNYNYLMANIKSVNKIWANYDSKFYGSSDGSHKHDKLYVLIA